MFSSRHVLLPTKPHDGSHLKLNVFCWLTAVKSKVLVTGTVRAWPYLFRAVNSSSPVRFSMHLPLLK